MDERQSDGDLASIESRASEFLARVEWLTSTTPNREDAFDLIFGLSGVYVRLFPTLEDRLALRELPARHKVFTILAMLPARP